MYECKRVEEINLTCFWWNDKENKCNKNISWNDDACTCLNRLEPKRALEIYNKAIEDVLALIEEHSKGNYNDFKENIIELSEYSYRDDECLALVEKIEKLKGENKND